MQVEQMSALYEDTLQKLMTRVEQLETTGTRGAMCEVHGARCMV
jgi:hypothetical protein